MSRVHRRVVAAASKRATNCSASARVGRGAVLGADDRADRERDRGQRDDGARRVAGALVDGSRSRSCRTWQVTQLDWIIVAFAAMLALFGFRQGFIVGVLSFGGFALGAFLGTRLGPLLLPRGSASPYAPAFGLIGALLGGAILASGLEGVGFRLRRTLIIPGWGCSTASSARCSALPGARRSCGSPPRSRRRRPGQGQLRADIQRSAILQRAQPGAAAVRADPERARAAGSAALDHRPVARRRALRSRRSLARAGVRRASRSVVRVDRQRLRPGDRGLGLGRGAGTWSSPTPTSSPASRTRRVEVGGHPPSLPAERSHSTRRTTSRCCGCPGSACPRSSLRLRTDLGHAGRDPRLSRERPVRRAAGTHRAHADGASPRTPTAGARCRAC